MLWRPAFARELDDSRAVAKNLVIRL